MEDNEEEVKQQKRNLHFEKKRQDKSDKELDQILDKGVRFLSSKRPDLVKLPRRLAATSIDEFYTAQDSLQQRYPGNDTIIKMMGNYDSWLRVTEASQWKKGKEETYKNFPSPQGIPSELMREFATVCRIRREVALGEDKGISSQLGDKAEKIIKKKFEKVRQSEIASRKRKKRKDALTQVLEEILADNPKATNKAIIKELKNQSGQGGTIDSVTPSHVEWTDEKNKGHKIKLSSLLNRISRLRKKQ
jgi:hypothetical protein